MSTKREQELEQFIKDAAGFIYWNANKSDEKTNLDLIAITLAHDINGLFYRKEYFSPRVSGYGKQLP